MLKIAKNNGTQEIRYAGRLGTLLNPTALQLISDILAIIVSYIVYYYFRFETKIFAGFTNPDVTLVITTGLVMALYWLLVLWFSGMYKNWYIRSPFDEMFASIKAIFLGSFILFFFIFLDSTKSPRMLFLVYFVLLNISIIISRLISRNIQKKLRSRRIIVIPSILIGNYSNIVELNHKITNSPAWGYKSIGFVLLGDEGIINKKENENNSLLGSIDNFDIILDEHKPKEVLIATETAERNLLLKIVSKCAERNILVKIVPDMYDIFTGQARTLPLYGIPLIEINTQLLRPWEEFIKRAIDIVFSLCVIIIGLPVWILVALIQKIESSGPVFYKQERVGKDGKSFMIFKFRSMVPDAEKAGPQWASVNDPRVTRFGKFLRSSHLDEVPQFWNVLKGEMSLVGPRPERPVFVDKFSKLTPYYKRRLVVRPGITGWWQVNYTTYVESIEEIENRLKDDFYYIENMSLKLDIEIIIRTVFLVIKGHGQT